MSPLTAAAHSKPFIPADFHDLRHESAYIKTPKWFYNHLQTGSGCAGGHCLERSPNGHLGQKAECNPYLISLDTFVTNESADKTSYY